MKETLRGANIPAAKSFLALVGASTTTEASCLSVDRLHGRDDGDFEVEANVCDADLLQIIRRNAFGPDFVTYSGCGCC